MRLAAVFLAFLAFAAPAAAATRAPAAVEQVAGVFAGRTVQVACYDRGEDGDPWSMGAWGYVWRVEEDPPVEHMAAEVCEGAAALATDDPLVDDWKKALGALVVAHESYHLARRYGASRHSEAATECRAVRHVRYAMRMLGATEGTAARLMGWALMLHWRLAARFPQYSLASCDVPNPY